MDFWTLGLRLTNRAEQLWKWLGMDYRRIPIRQLIMVCSLTLFLSFVSTAWALYDGSEMGDLDASRPPDTGEAASNGAKAIRELKRAFLAGIDKEHIVSSSATFDGKHHSNFLAAVYFQTNGIPTWAFGTNTVPSYAQVGGIISQMVWVASLDAPQAESASITVATPTALVGSINIPSNTYAFVRLEADVSCRNGRGTGNSYYLNLQFATNGVAIGQVYTNRPRSKTQWPSRLSYQFVGGQTQATTAVTIKVTTDRDDSDVGAGVLHMNIIGIN